MTPLSRSNVRAAPSLPPLRRMAVLLVAGLILIAVINILPGYLSRSTIQEKMELVDKLRRAEDELKVTSQQLNALKQAAAKQSSGGFVHEKGKPSNDEVEDVPDKQRNQEIVVHKQLQSAKDEILQLEAELRRAKEKQQENSIKDGDIPDYLGKKINQRFVKVSFEKSSPEYRKTTYRAIDTNSDSNELIVLSSIAHSNSYGAGRTFADFIDTIKSIEFERTMSTLGLLVGSKDEYNNILKYMDANSDDTFFSKVIVLQAQFIEDLYKLDRDIRHSLAVQKERRRAISRARNFLITNALGDEEYSLCLDADMIETPSDLLQVFVNSGKDIVVPRIRQGGAENYDFNSWVGHRLVPNAEQSKHLDEKDPDFLFVPGPDGAAHMHDFVNDEKWGNNQRRDFAVPLDSVGGAVLFVKSEVFKQGVLFPPFYVVGTTWDRFEGYDGIETEGLCYQARTIGYQCWGLPNVVAFHDVELQDG